MREVLVPVGGVLTRGREVEVHEELALSVVEIIEPICGYVAGESVRVRTDSLKTWEPAGTPYRRQRDSKRPDGLAWTACLDAAAREDTSLAYLKALEVIGNARRECLALGCDVTGIDARMKRYRDLLALMGAESGQ